MAMSRRHWRSIARTICLGLLCVSGASAHAAEGGLLDFLRQIQQAAHALDYSGVYVYQEGAALQSTRIVHIVDGTGERERLVLLDGPARECIRQNNIQQCLHPGRKTVVKRPARSDHFPGILQGKSEAVAHHYEWEPSSRRYRIAGRDCRVSELKARDTLRYSYRICTDAETHLLLKSQTLDAQGRLVDQMAFGSIRLGADVSPGDLESPWDTSQWDVDTESSQPVDLSAKGWRFSLPAGFVPVAEVSRPIGRDHSVDQLVLSDGLAVISVFIETFDPNHDQTLRQGGIRQGAINVYRMRLASYWLTAVGEVPAQTVRDLAQAVQYVPQAAH